MLTSFVATCLCLATAGTADRPCVLIVVGAPGAPEYKSQFDGWADLWQAAALKAAVESIRIGSTDNAGTTDRERLCSIIVEKRAAASREPLWIVLIGHGTYDGREAKLNLR